MRFIAPLQGVQRHTDTVSALRPTQLMSCLDSINQHKQTNKQTNNNNTELSVISVFPREVAENRAVDTVALVQVYLSVLLFFRQCHSTSAPHSVTYTHSTSAPHSQSPTLIPPVPHTQSPTLIPPVPHTHSHLHAALVRMTNSPSQQCSLAVWQHLHLISVDQNC